MSETSKLDWQIDFLEWCKKESDEATMMADRLECGISRFFTNNQDVSAKLAADYRRIEREMTQLIPRVEADLKS